MPEPRIESPLEVMARQLAVETALKPPYLAECPECGKKAVSAKSSGTGYEVSCDGCRAVFYEGDLDEPDLD